MSAADTTTSTTVDPSTSIAPTTDTTEDPQYNKLTDYESQLAVEQTDPTSPLYSAKGFDDLNLPEPLLKGVYAMGFNKPSKIQETALPIILGAVNTKRTNLIAQAQSGTGKTATFTLAMLSRADPNIPSTQALCLCPTRDLARQNYDVCLSMGKFTKHTPLLAIPDVPIPPKINNTIVIGTPGKIEDLIKRRALSLDKLVVFVLDEADVMIATQGFQETCERIKRTLSKECQILLFSATFSDELGPYSMSFVPRPLVTIRLKKEELSIDKLRQYYIDCKSEDNKYKTLCDVYGNLTAVGQSIIFVKTIDTANTLQRKMKADSFPVSVLTSKVETQLRDQIMDDFKNGLIRVLIATNVLSRGIDVLQVSLVVNYDLPVTKENAPDPETYLHRIGRSARFGRPGTAINFVHDAYSMHILRQIEAHFKRDIEKLDNVEKLSGYV
eukprot:TRINITY_DN7399_c0_g1_i1.p1 TRINITY_DN7399_c0_g1~~TRINITY_DN7399_c0_g1_i1.p1  ORF type:complete len:441 (-),score=115.68 TRINITY_DN7399_c0_g1_i1:35-1357(-)